MEFVTYLTSFINCFSLVALLVMRGIALYKNADYQQRRINHIKNKQPIDMVDVETQPLTSIPSPEPNNHTIVNRRDFNHCINQRYINSVNQNRTGNDILLNNCIKLSDDSSSSPNELNNSQPISGNSISSYTNSPNQITPPNRTVNTSPNPTTETLITVSSIESNKAKSFKTGFNETNSD